MMNILLTICARGGSKGVKKKNIRKLMGKPLINYTIQQAIKWGRATKIVVSTDSEEIADIVKKSDIDVPFIRPRNLAEDTTPKIPVIRHALMECEKKYKCVFPIVVDLDVTSPIRSIKDIEKCYQLFVEKKPYTLFSAVNARKSPYFSMVELDQNGWASLSKQSGKEVYRRQDAPVVFDLNGSIYFYDREFLLNGSTINVVTDRSIVYKMDDISAFDLDREIDFKFIEFLMKEKIFIPDS